MPSEDITVVNGWSLYFHPLIIEQISILTNKVEKLKAKYPQTFQTKNDTKRLAAIEKLLFSVIPSDPTQSLFRQGGTLGRNHKHWFRAKFFQQYRLFFRFDYASKIIIFAWVNDEKTKRAYDSKTDAYLTFKKMLESGNPPDDWAELIEVCKQSTQPA